MTTYGFTGAPEGSFKVTVTTGEVTGGAQSQEEAMKAMTGEIELSAEQHVSLVAEQFGGASTTPLTITLPTSEKIVVFDVGESVRIERKMPGMR
ncbi:MAG: hypothetical protein HUK22_06425 [Thermoguttaceae bacterium]|nr:hypothetical protein [Thermoguttaceae bacterium]